MKKPVIEVNNISKSYKISHKIAKNAHPTIKDEMVRMSRKPLEILGAKGGVDKEDFQALNNVSFEVGKGEVVGVMGRNGSGKSTLFKILSRITQPTSGSANLRGTVASLLEVGTGFHPELTGRENVYLNGSIMGMKKHEIDHRFNDIVEFSEVEKFIDTPVKFYSSGMKVRLAFSVAAHLDADILLIDEVLAVGDLKFKQKSIERMRQIAASGKTILFVSHIVRHIKRLCTRGIVLSDGEIVLDAGVDEAIDHYLELLNLDESQIKDAEAEDGTDNEGSAMVELKVLSAASGIENDRPVAKITIDVKNNLEEKITDLRLLLRINSQLGQNVAILTNDIAGKDFSLDKNQTKIVEFNILDFPVLPDVYNIRLVLRDIDSKGKKYALVKNAGTLTVPEYKNSMDNNIASEIGERRLFDFSFEESEK